MNVNGVLLWHDVCVGNYGRFACGSTGFTPTRQCLVRTVATGSHKTMFGAARNSAHTLMCKDFSELTNNPVEENAMAQKDKRNGPRRTLSWLSMLILMLLIGFGVEWVGSQATGNHARTLTIPDPDEAGWGAASLQVDAGTGRQFQLISLANACGLGSSSCFKCHNGSRAEQPAAEPWHTQHDNVNRSCDGCHGGNPRLMKESMSHRGLVVNPIEQPQEYCYKCHAGSDAPALLGQYVQTAKGRE